MFDDASATLVFALLVFVIVAKKVRRNIGRQRAGPVRLVIRIVLLGAVSMLLALPIWIADPDFLVAGVVGAALAVFAVRLTAFGSDANGPFFTPNVFIGTAVVALVVGRLAYRLFKVFPLLGSMTLDVETLRNYLDRPDEPPVTLALLFLLTVFKTCYYVGVFIRRRRLLSIA